MRILIDIGHPAHVHLFKNLALHFEKKGHQVLFTTRKKEFEIELLRAYGLRYKLLGNHYKSLVGKILSTVKFEFKLLFISLRFRPDLFLSHGSIIVSHISTILRRPNIVLEDCGNMEQVRLYRPFASAILTPMVLPVDLGPKQIRYNGYHEIAYLHPNYFTPDKTIREKLGLRADEKYCILRFVSWQATHDIGNKGFSPSEKKTLVLTLSKIMRVFITSEAALPAELKQYQIKLLPHLIHHALAFAEIVVSEGATIASEAGILGTPAIYVNPVFACNNHDQEKYGTVINFKSGQGVLKKVMAVLSQDKEDFEMKSRKLLNDKIDVTEFLIHYTEQFQLPS